MNKKIIYGCVLLFSASNVYAGAAMPNFHSDAQFYSDSDDLEVDQWSVGYRQSAGIFSHLHENEPEKKLLWSAKATRNDIDQTGKDDYRGYDIGTTLGHRFNKNLSAQLGIGDSTLENRRTGEDDHLTNYSMKGKVKLNQQITLHATHERDYLFDNSIIEDDAGQLIHGDSSDIGLFWRPHDKWRVEGRANHLSLSDSNNADKLSGALLYGISPGWPWIWTGVTTEKLSFDQNKNSYWTPDDYQSVGVTLDSSIPVNDDLSLNFGANVNRSKEDDNPSGTGYSLSAGANWDIGENVSLKANGYVLESTQETSDWKQDGVNLSVSVKSF